MKVPISNVQKGRKLPERTTANFAKKKDSPVMTAAAAATVLVTESVEEGTVTI